MKRAVRCCVASLLLLTAGCSSSEMMEAMDEGIALEIAGRPAPGGRIRREDVRAKRIQEEDGARVCQTAVAASADTCRRIRCRLGHGFAERDRGTPYGVGKEQRRCT